MYVCMWTGTCILCHLDNVLTAQQIQLYTSHTHCMTGVQYGCTVEFATTNGAIYTMVEWLQVNIATGSLIEGQY